MVVSYKTMQKHRKLDEFIDQNAEEAEGKEE